MPVVEPLDIRRLEIVLEAFQGLETIASSSDTDAALVGKAMVPIIFQFEQVLHVIQHEIGCAQSPKEDPKRPRLFEFKSSDD